ncbi:uncharacterized protein TNCV_2197651 [Trichonephila clavipes]|nr:uncharacterized protein TNCV_2197651 [Trichonephila clavipes]
MTSTEKLSRRPPLRKKCTCAANCFIGHHPGKGSTFIRGLCVFSNHHEGTWLKNICDRGAHTCAVIDAHPSTPPFGVEPRTMKLDCSRIETGLLSLATRERERESRFNLSSDDNRVRVCRSRGQRLNSTFALQRHTSSTAVVMV